MARILVLGPGSWDDQRWQRPPLETPLQIRRRITLLLTQAGHHATIMEDEPDTLAGDVLEKFLALLDNEPWTDIFVYWPARAKMQTTFDELLILRLRMDRGLPRLWYLVDPAAGRPERSRFQVLEPGGRSRYLEALHKLPARVLLLRSGGEAAAIHALVAILGGY